MARAEVQPEHKQGPRHSFLLGLGVVVGVEIVRRLKKGPLFTAYTDTRGRIIFEPISFSAIKGTAEQVIESISLGLHPWSAGSDEHSVTFHDPIDTEHLRRRPTVETRGVVKDGPKPKKRSEDIHDPDEKKLRESPSLFPEGLQEFLKRVDELLEE